MRMRVRECARDIAVRCSNSGANEHLGLTKSQLENSTHKQLTAKFHDFFRAESVGAFPSPGLFVDAWYGNMSRHKYSKYTWHTGFHPGLLDATVEVLSGEAVAQTLGGIKYLLENGWHSYPVVFLCKRGRHRSVATMRITQLFLKSCGISVEFLLHPKSWYDQQYACGKFCGFVECQDCNGALEVDFVEWVLREYERIDGAWY